VKAPARARVLAGMALQYGWTRMAELGVLHGATTAHLLRACPELRIYAVDTWQPGNPSLDPPVTGRRGPDDDGYRSYAEVDMEAAYEWALTLAARYPRRLQVMRMGTLTAAERMVPDSLCAVFVDGDHRTEAVKADIRAWLPAIKRGGWLTGHDAGHHSVKAALDDVCPGYVVYDGDVWAIQRSKVAA
jgi:hypothetical protein